MRGVFWKYRFAGSCGFFLLFSFFLASVNTRTPYTVDPVGVVLMEVLHPLQLGAALTWQEAQNLWQNYVSLLALRQENERLRRQLQAMQRSAQRARELDLANQRLAALLALKEGFSGGGIAARVVGRSPLRWVRTVVLDKGGGEGVHAGMAVLAPEGVVGRVLATSPHAARVLLLSDPESGVDALVQRTRVRGIVQGTPGGICVLKYVPWAEDVRVGDAVITSGLDGIFPKGQLIGWVVRVERKAGQMFQEVEVAPSVELAKVEEVLVVSQRASP